VKIINDIILMMQIIELYLFRADFKKKIFLLRHKLQWKCLDLIFGKWFENIIQT